MNRLIFFVRIIALVGLIAALCFQFQFDTIANAIHRPLSFTIEVHRRLRIFGIIEGFLSAVVFSSTFLFKNVLTLYAKKGIEAARSDLQLYIKELKTFVQTNKKALISALAVTILGASLRAYFLNTEFKYDESANYILFADRPFFSIFTMYTLPNNHILHTVLMRVSLLLFGNSEFSLRLPAFIAGILCIPMTYFSARMLFQKEIVAFIAASGVAVLTQLVEFSTSSRGYSIQCLLALISFFFFLKISKKSKLLDQLIAGIALGLGFVAIPTMLFAASVISFWLVLNKKPNLKTIFFIVTIAGGTTLIGYLPAILFVGAEKIYKNPFVTPQSWSEFMHALPQFCRDLYVQWTFGHIQAAPYLVGGILIIGTYNFRVISRYRLPMLFPVLAGIFFCLFVTNRIPPFRTMVCVAPFFMIAVAESLVALFYRYEKILRSVVAFVAILLGTTLIWKNSTPELVLFPESKIVFGISNIAKRLTQELGPNDRVVVPFPDDIVFHYYFVNRYNGDARKLISGVPPLNSQKRGRLYAFNARNFGEFSQLPIETTNSYKLIELIE